MGHFDFQQTIEARGQSFTMNGMVDERFMAVWDAFLTNFQQEEELGAACSLIVDGELMVDIWGGWARADHSAEWDRDSTVCMMSVAKGITGIAFNMCVDKGLIDIDLPVAHYWPEFAQNGKQDILVRWCLDHRAGIPVLTTDTLWPGAFLEYEPHIKAPEGQEPLWPRDEQGPAVGAGMDRVEDTVVGVFIGVRIIP